ncbi:MAG: UDP-glucose/GDP-mannose dehydrogenase family protein [Candidatus Marinimicrobia bacterium]|nr:UDP-glucose/GDP-mannose dehydrogenase family protein [Candidatus Neomarinimicrobiota bacterium]
MKRIIIIGTGYVGLVSGAGISDFGHRVRCVDIDKQKIDLLNNGGIPIYEPGLKTLISRNINANRLTFTVDVEEAIKWAEFIFIAVGTPQGENGDVDISAVIAVAEDIGKNLNNYKVICTKSTVPIGTGKMIQKIIDQNNLNKIKYDYCSNPEFLREGSAVRDFLYPDRIVLGTTSDKAFEYLKDVYRSLYINKTPLVHTTVETAEMIKYASNAFLAIKISYINEVANLCDEIGADVHVVAKTLGTDGRISPKFLHPGPGFGGSCFPKDTKALVEIAKKYNIHMATVTAAIETNIFQRKRMLSKLMDLLDNDLKGKIIAVLGLAFKQETDDVRDSPAIEIINSIHDTGGIIKAYDPIANDSMKEIFPELDYKSNWHEAVEGCDAVVIMTEWNEFRSLDLEKLKNLMSQPVVLDTRNILNVSELKRLEFKFDNVGRRVA